MHAMSADTKKEDTFSVRRRTGDTTFNALCLLGSLFLFTQMWTQTTWASGQNFAAQPGFWPRLAVIGMVVFSALNLLGSLRDPLREERMTGVGEELVVWLKSLQYALWFMAYVFVTPVIGYLPASVLFAVALSLWVGHRSGTALLWAALAGAATVLLFKSLLMVRIPGGALYEALPETIRNFFILYL
jgi:hypothetical protein